MDKIERNEEWSEVSEGYSSTDYSDDDFEITETDKDIALVSSTSGKKHSIKEVKEIKEVNHAEVIAALKNATIDPLDPLDLNIGFIDLDFILFLILK